MSVGVSFILVKEYLMGQSRPQEMSGDSTLFLILRGRGGGMGVGLGVVITGGEQGHGSQEKWITSVRRKTLTPSFYSGCYLTFEEDLLGEEKYIFAERSIVYTFKFNIFRTYFK